MSLFGKISLLLTSVGVVIISFYNINKVKFLFSSFFSFLCMCVTFIMGRTMTEGLKIALYSLIIAMIADFLTKMYALSDQNRNKKESLYKGFKNALDRKKITSSTMRRKSVKKFIQYFSVIIICAQLSKIISLPPYNLSTIADGFMVFVVFKFTFNEMLSLFENVASKDLNLEDIKEKANEIMDIVKSNKKKGE